MNGMKILLVDDVDFFLQVEKDILRFTPATIHTARNGREALEVAARHRPDLIFMDVNMPVMDGLSCCRLLKENISLRSIPVVMVFAPGRSVSEATCREAGCDGVLTKPINSRSFLEMGRRFHAGIERRAERLQDEVPLSFRCEGKSCPGIGLDISEGGIFVASTEKLAEDDRLKIALLLPGAGPEGIELRGRVAWVNQGPLRPRRSFPEGFGVEFRSVRPEAAGVLAEHIAERKASRATRVPSAAVSAGKKG